LTSFKQIIILTFIVLFINTIYGQELSGITKNEPFTLNGGVSATSVFFHSPDSLNVREPFTYVLNGNLNFVFFGIINCPFNFTYSNYSENFSHPFNFNQFGIQPSYKWIKTYLGYNSMSFSSYTLSGHQFLGAGIELTPPDKPIKVSVMYGRLLKPVEEDTLNLKATPSFARYGYGFKIGYLFADGEVSLILFNAYDDVSSLNKLPVKTIIKPQENLAISLNATKKIFERLMFTVEYASTAITDDRRIMEKREGKNIFKLTDFLMTNSIATSYYNAFNTSIKYSGKSYSVGSTYERIDPGYTTLGAYYFTNDFENITLDASKSLMKNKINLSGRIGLQRNDLDDMKLSKTKKVVGNINLSYAINKKININSTYSNFTGYTFIRNDFDYINEQNPYKNLDTLNYTQINQNIAVNVNYILGDIKSKEKQQSLNFNFNMQHATSEQGNNTLPGADFYNGNIAYSLGLLKKKITVFSSINSNYTKAPNSFDTFTLGPTAGINKSLFDKTLRVSTSMSYNSSFNNAKANVNSVLVFRTSCNYILQKKHNFNLSFIVQNRNINPKKNITDLTVTIGYRYNFKTSYNEIFK